MRRHLLVAGLLFFATLVPAPAVAECLPLKAACADVDYVLVSSVGTATAGSSHSTSLDAPIVGSGVLHLSLLGLGYGFSSACTFGGLDPLGPGNIDPDIKFGSGSGCLNGVFYDGRLAVCVEVLASTTFGPFTVTESMIECKE